MSLLPMERLPDGILEECISRLSLTERLQTNKLSSRFRDLQKESSALQYSNLLDRLSITGSSSSSSSSSSSKLHQLQHIEESLQNLNYGTQSITIDSVKIEDWAGFVPGLLTVYNDQLIMAGGWDLVQEEATHLNIYDLSNMIQPSAEPRIVELEGGSFSTFLACPVEGVLVVMRFEEAISIGPITIGNVAYTHNIFSHKIDFYNLETLEPYQQPSKGGDEGVEERKAVSGLLLSASQSRSCHHRLHLRGDYLVVTILDGLDSVIPGEELCERVEVYQWKSSKKIWQLSFPKEKRSIFSAEMISSMTLVVATGHRQAMSLQVYQISAVGSSSTPNITHITTLNLPRLTANILVRDMTLQSSSPSLSNRTKARSQGDDQLMDGHGIVHLHMEMFGSLTNPDGSVGQRWVGGTSAYVLIDHLDGIGSTTAGDTAEAKILDWEHWGRENVHWLPSSQRPLRGSLCGYRLFLPRTGGLADPFDAFSCLQIYDFSSMNIKRHLVDKKYDQLPPLPENTIKEVVESTYPMLVHEFIFEGNPVGDLPALRVTKRCKVNVPHVLTGMIDQERIILQHMVETGPEPEDQRLDITIMNRDAIPEQLVPK